jgi:hypothetical protein
MLLLSLAWKLGLYSVTLAHLAFFPEVFQNRYLLDQCMSRKFLQGSRLLQYAIYRY